MQMLCYKLLVSLCNFKCINVFGKVIAIGRVTMITLSDHRVDS